MKLSEGTVISLSVEEKYIKNIDVESKIIITEYIVKRQCFKDFVIFDKTT